MVEDSVCLPGRSAMDNVEMLYARQVFVYNDHVIKGGVLPSMVDMFTEATATLDDKVRKQCFVVDLCEVFISH